MKKYDVIPTRINEAREASGLSMKELSEIIGVSSQAISQYEHGVIKPSIFVLKKISNELGFPFEFFLKEKEIPLCSNSAIYFRAMKSTPKKIKDAYSYRVAWSDEILRYLKRFIKFCELNFPLFEEYDFSNEIEDHIIEEMADKLRIYWGLGDKPIDNLIEVLENNGIVVCKISFKNRKVEAFSQWYNGVPYIFSGANRESSVSLRFSIAHELGHILMHYSIGKNDVYNKNILDRIESEANKFAAALLMPSKSFSEDIINNSLDYLIYIKEKWKVSLGAIIKRCAYLKILSDNQVNYLYKQIAARQIRVKEPLDDVIAVEEPKLFKEAIELLLDNKIITLNLFLSEISLPINEVINICSLPENYFDSDDKLSKSRLTLLD